MTLQDFIVYVTGSIVILGFLKLLWFRFLYPADFKDEKMATMRKDIEFLHKKLNLLEGYLNVEIVNRTTEEYEPLPKRRGRPRK